LSVKWVRFITERFWKRRAENRLDDLGLLVISDSSSFFFTIFPFLAFPVLRLLRSCIYPRSLVLDWDFSLFAHRFHCTPSSLGFFTLVFYLFFPLAHTGFFFSLLYKTDDGTPFHELWLWRLLILRCFTLHCFASFSPPFFLYNVIT